MNEQIRFSIVIPVYNRIKNLDSCVENVLSQDYSNYELILVNDASSDGTGELCEKYAKEHDNIIAVNNLKNSGPGISRNNGMDKAKGDYLIFLDSDDRYDNNLLSIVAKNIDGRNPDILVYSLSEEYYNEKGDLIHKYSHSIPSTYLNTPHDIHELIMLLEEETMLGYPWNKAFNLEYIRRTKARFQDIEHIEDILFNIDAFEEVSSIVVLEDMLYHYCNVARNRLTDKYLPNYFELQCNRIWKLYEQQKRWGTLNEHALNILAKEYFRWLLSAVERKINQGEAKNEIRIFLAKEFNSMLYALLHEHLDVGPKLRTLYKPMLDRNTKKTISLAKKISTVKRKAPQLFSALKQNR